MKDRVVVTENPFGMSTEKSVGASIVLTSSCLTCQHQFLHPDSAIVIDQWKTVFAILIYRHRNRGVRGGQGLPNIIASRCN